jgi:pyridoxal phosphate enzyme (YggS family)
VAELIASLDAGRVRDNLARVRDAIAEACPPGRDPTGVEVLAAVKYVRAEQLGALAEAGVTLLGENRAQELEAKAAAWEGRAPFTWDFIGQLQSRKVRQVLPHVRRIHSVASDSVLRELAKHGEGSGVEVLVEVNVAGDPDKSGILPEELDAFVARCPLPVAGLMTMPPLAARPEDSRRHFAALAALAAERGLRELSMGTTQDFQVAVEEGATVVRLGSVLFR